eukprot:scaffold3738_cov129-Isochrysis_galbana.AAC.1
MAQHHLLIFSQKTNGQPFIRIDTDTSMANYEGEPTKANIITLSTNMIDTDYTLTHAPWGHSGNLKKGTSPA